MGHKLAREQRINLAGTFQKGKFYQEKTTGKAMAIVADIPEVYYPYENDVSGHNLVAQFSDGAVAYVYTNTTIARTQYGVDEQWEEITKAEYISILAKVRKANIKAVALERVKAGI